MAAEMEAITKQDHGLGVIFRKRDIGWTVGTEIAAFSELWTKHRGEDWGDETEDFRGNEEARNRTRRANNEEDIPSWIDP